MQSPAPYRPEPESPPSPPSDMEKDLKRLKSIRQQRMEKLESAYRLAKMKLRDAEKKLNETIAHVEEIKHKAIDEKDQVKRSFIDTETRAHDLIFWTQMDKDIDDKVLEAQRAIPECEHAIEHARETIKTSKAAFLKAQKGVEKLNIIEEELFAESE